MKSLLIETAFIPGEACLEGQSICVVIDAIRASGTIVTLFQQRCGQILLTEDESRSIEEDDRIRLENYCICAEREEGDRAALAEVSPSLADIHKMGDLKGRNILFRTTNGTRGIRALYGRGVENILVGSLLNADAVMETAVSMAVSKELGICLVSAGRHNGRISCIDDSYSCGRLAETGVKYAKKQGIPVELADSSKIALRLASTFTDGKEAFSMSATGQIMRNVNSEIDILLCAEENISNMVPLVTGVDRNGHVIINLK
ncbi:MAG TPA: 2-phosphosulfolactate phosphatase [Candidatus Lachnoclostridium stercoravium]|uniref:Probable 2-phosphosulfolactate phosphatase n=1 Tax=Candidatus Lachnoclostridium stercoravium TaxID=2838633 RepID=A0A9D2HJZ6_9FIRM|nr:2-phosphosulfolactate phosphatase [Candidatus Lachnoclostridium stercoravium]